MLEEAPTGQQAPQKSQSWSADIGAGIVVCLVALPLCLGIALASGAPLVSGLISGVIGGLVIAFVGRTPLLVSGPAAGLAAIVLAAILELGSFEAFLAATLVAGLMQVGFGALKAGRLAALVPSSVVTGMLAAIGVLIILQQLPYAMGTVPEKAKGLGLLLVPFKAIPQTMLGPALCALVTLIVLGTWGKLRPGKLDRMLPGPLVAVVIGTLLAEVLSLLGPGLALLPAHRVDLPDISAGPGGVFTTPDWSALLSGTTWKVAVTLAVVASLETLLSLEATDRMDPLKRRSNPNRELLAQGVGNSLAGLIGGLPLTGVIVRSTANVMAGGRTWKAAFVHGVLLAGAVAAVPFLLERIPLSVLAAILLHTGWKLAHPTRFAAAHQIGWTYLVPLVVTVGAVVATDLLVGVGIGLLTSAILTLRMTARHGVKVVAEAGRREVEVQLAEAVSFVHKARLRRILDDFAHSAPKGARLKVDGSRTRAFDHDVVELLHGFHDTARDRGIHYDLVGVPSLEKAA